ncbi:DUF1566 domain-containing protein [Pseudovibrio sp. SPO723]|uniref:Lcl C-terminal domain-containing protein n=1 Tax=Nesiotobacter zosterae TaxID=392721 RepID=UPI0029C43F4D|nr:DUF1566 domain-containing protein [Pseudovibrio sp. SPO723]MDX5592302.1 DUF1566 domain-containing protein [Pseudovibrio sp. SPO723]
MPAPIRPLLPYSRPKPRSKPRAWLINNLLAASLSLTLFPVEAAEATQGSLSYPIVDTGASLCFGTNGELPSCPGVGKTAFGQDAQYQGNAPSYSKGSGTVTDNVTQLMWSQTTDLNGDGAINASDKLTVAEAKRYADAATIGGHSDWRLPTIKELYSLIQFDGQDVSGPSRSRTLSAIPFIDSRVFGFGPGDTKSGERLIDSLFITSSRYVSTTMRGDTTYFGVNFIDGRIKGYGTSSPRGEKTFYVLLVRGKTTYGRNAFRDQKDGTVLDRATGLTWQQQDSTKALRWTEALAYCEGLRLGGRNDWRLPNVKELQSIVDYSRSPDTSRSAAINTVFEATPIRNEAGQQDFAQYWSSTIHRTTSRKFGGAYVAFGRSLVNMRGSWLDVHGAGSQRSDPITGNAKDYAQGFGPQGDAIRIENFARCVAGGAILVAQPKQTRRPAETYEVSQSAQRQRPQNAGEGRRPPPPGHKRPDAPRGKRPLWH